MKNNVYATGSLSFELPDEFPRYSGAIGLPKNPKQWVGGLKRSIESEDGGISLFAEMIADGGEAVMLTFAPCKTPRENGEIVGDNFYIVLSQDGAIKLGKALIALAELNRR